MKNTLLLALLTALAAFLPFYSFAQIYPVKVDGPSKEVPIPNALPHAFETDCDLLKATVKKQSDGRGACCYKITLSNDLSAQSKLFPAGFQVSIKNGNITDMYAASNAWQQTPSAAPPKAKQVKWSHTSFKIPPGQTDVATICVEGLTPIWLQYAWLDRAGKVLCRDSVQLADCVNEPTDLCDKPLIQNGGFAQTNGATASWAKAYGNPKFLNTPGEGCFDPGYVEISGNQTGGDAIRLTMNASNKILQGKKYLLTVGVRFFAQQNTLNYARIRAVAFNGSLLLNGSHSAPSANVAIIGRSGKIKDCGAWSVIEFPVWTANKDFSNIALNVFTDGGATSKIWIDNVSVCEVTWDSDCLEVQLDASGKPIMPPGFGQVPPGFACQPEEENDEYNNGSLSDLYGGLYGYDGTTNWYSKASDKCFSLGGTIPPEVTKFNCDDSLRLAGINMTCEELRKMLENPRIDTSARKLPSMPPLPMAQTDCPIDFPQSFYNMAFHGRDIIYIHGLQLDHLCDRANGVKGANANWPLNQNEFYTGYYKNIANANWKPHIDYFLRGKGNKNRYLIVTYNCSQPAEVAIHSVLSQIKKAMESGDGVEADPSDFRGKNCFGRDYVFVSHSTGAIVADAALSIANLSKTVKNVTKQYGDIGLIADRCKGRVSLHGAFTGSSLATLLVGAQQNSVLSGIASAGLTKGVCKTDFTTAANQAIVLGSILVDLIPPITRLKWGPFIATVPVPVLNVSGGHPSAIINVLKYGMHIGFDDGVVSMDCANALVNQPSNFVSSFPPKVFDMGIPKIRAVNFYLDQRMLANRFGAAFTPYLSPTGMVQPVLAAIPMAQAPNHYSFVQAASEHLMPKNAAYFVSCNYDKTAFSGDKNYEEELVVTDSRVYSLGLVDKSIAAEMREDIKGRYIYYPSIKIKIVKGFPKPVVCWKKFYIWKRTYHTLGIDCWYDCDYVYRYAFKT